MSVFDTHDQLKAMAVAFDGLQEAFKTSPETWSFR